MTNKIDMELESKSSLQKENADGRVGHHLGLLLMKTTELH